MIRYYCIEINDETPLHKVIFQFELAGYRQLGVPMEDVGCIRTCQIPESQGKYFEFLNWHINAVDESYQRITLKQLKQLAKGGWL